MRKAIINMGQCLLALVVISLNSCWQPVNGAGTGSEEVGGMKDRVGNSFEIREIDGCEYVTYKVGTQLGLLTHKGNCKNPVHAR